MTSNTPDRWFQATCEGMEAEIGRGWKRALAEKVGVGESNVQVWLRSGRVPAAVRRAIELSDEVESLQRRVNKYERLISSRWISEESYCGAVTFSVHEMDRKTGRARLIAKGISELKDAHAIAGIPQVEQILEQTYSALQLSDGEEEVALCHMIEIWPQSSALEKEAEYQNSLAEIGR